MSESSIARPKDAPVPMWWTLTSACLVLVAMGYWTYTVTFARPSAEAQQPIDVSDVTDEDVLALAADPATVALGRETFSRNCVQCHGKKAEGFSGPNLTDDFWIKGGRPAENLQTIVNGRAGKMPPWGRVLGVGTCKALAAYLETLRGSNVKGKPPEGTEVFLTRDEDTP